MIGVGYILSDGNSLKLHLLQISLSIYIRFRFILFIVVFSTTCKCRAIVFLFCLRFNAGGSIFNFVDSNITTRTSQMEIQIRDSTGICELGNNVYVSVCVLVMWSDPPHRSG